MTLVPSTGGDLTNRVDEPNAHHPLVCGELDFSCKVVNMPNKGSHYLPRSIRGLGTYSIDDILGELWVEARRRRGSHDYVVGTKGFCPVKLLVGQKKC